MHAWDMPQRYLWLLDAGHAPDTPGKRSPDGSLREYAFNRAVVGYVAQSLARRGIAYHVLTPATEHDFPPSDRAALANDIEARCPIPTRLVSVHSNAYGDGTTWTDPEGITVLHYPGSSVAADLARLFLETLVSSLRWRDRGLRERSDLTLLKRSRMPAILTETGFYTNRQECAELADPAVQQRVAAAHVAAIVVSES